MVTRLWRKSVHEVFHAAEKRSGGRITKKTTSGFSVTRGIAGNKLNTNPAMTRRIE